MGRSDHPGRFRHHAPEGPRAALLAEWPARRTEVIGGDV